MTVANDLAVRRALVTAGVEFIDENGGGPGVRLRKQSAAKIIAPTHGWKNGSLRGPERLAAKKVIRNYGPRSFSLAFPSSASIIAVRPSIVSRGARHPNDSRLLVSTTKFSPIRSQRSE